MPVAFVQEADAASSSVTLGVSATAGNTLVVAVACLGPTSATGVAGVTLGGFPDNFALLTPGPSARDTASPGDYISVSVWADANCAGGSAVITVTGTGVLAVWAWEFSGLSGTADLAQVFAVPAYQDSWVTALPETTLPAEAWFAVTCAANQTAAETLTVNNVTGWALETAHGGTSGSYDWGGIAGYQAVNTMGAPAWSGSFSQPSFSVTAVVTMGAGVPPVPAAAETPLTGDVTVRGDLTVRGTTKSGGVISQGGTPVGLTPVGPKTGNYTAKPGDFVLVSGSQLASVTVTLPAAPPNGTLIGVSLINAPESGLTVQASGTDVIGAVPAGTTSVTPAVIGTVFVLQYQTSTGTWYTQSTGGQLPGAPALNSPQPADGGFVAWSYDYTALGGTFAGVALPSGGNACLVKCPVRATGQLAGIRYWITATGSGLTTGENFAGVYSSGGDLIAATPDMTATWGSSTGLVDTLFTGEPFAINPPYVWAAFLCNGTTGPSLAATGNQTTAWANGRLAAGAGTRYGHLAAAHASLPSSFSLLGIDLSAAEYWAGLW